LDLLIVMASQIELNQIQNSIWNGSLPLEIRLSPSDCRIYDQSDPYLVGYPLCPWIVALDSNNPPTQQIQYPRLSYLPFLLPRLHAFFDSVLINPDIPAHEGWFSFEDVPLKWHYPVGLLYDLFSGASPASSSKPAPTDRAIHQDIDGGESALPWRLVVHFTQWPDEQLVRLDDEGKFLHDAFINGVKEADFLRNGTAKGIMSLSKDDSTQLWKVVVDREL
jgi:autophagy-related protein 5